MKVLLTGAAGAIGRVLAPGLVGLGHEVACVDLPGRGAEHAVDVTDPAAVEHLVGQVRPDAVVHLAGIPGETSLPDALHSHVISTAALLEAMVRHDVRRIVYASSNHAVGRTPRGEGTLAVTVHGRPDTFYGVAKVAAEGLLRLYADRHGLDTVVTRIGSFLPAPTSRRHLSTWLSHADAVRLYAAALSAESPGYAVVYGISANTRAWWDLAPGRALGYHPEDDAEDWSADIVTVPRRPVDDDEATFVGGPYATPSMERPAFDPA